MSALQYISIVLGIFIVTEGMRSFYKQILVSSFEPETYWINQCVLRINYEKWLQSSTPVILHCHVSSELFFSFRFCILLIQVMKVYKREIFKNPNFLYTYNFKSAIKNYEPYNKPFPSDYSQSN